MILIEDFEVAPSMSDAVSFGMPKYSSSIFFIYICSYSSFSCLVLGWLCTSAFLFKNLKVCLHDQIYRSNSQETFLLRVPNLKGNLLR